MDSNNDILKGEVIHIVSDERARNFGWEQNASKLDARLQILSIDDARTIQDGNEYDIDFQGAVYPGVVLAKHPFLKKKYLDINAAEDIFFKDKIDCMFRISSNLGARQCEVKALFIEEQNREINVDGGISYKCVNLKGEARTKLERKYASTYERKECFLDTPFTLDHYDTAKRISCEYGLDKDSDIAYLIKQRNPNERSFLTEQKVKIEMTRELNSILECAFSLNVLGGIFSLNAGIKNTISTKNSIVLETHLIF